MRINLAVYTATEGFDWQPGTIYSRSELNKFKEMIGRFPDILMETVPYGGIFVCEDLLVFYRLHIARRGDSRGRDALYCVLGTIPLEAGRKINLSRVFELPEFREPMRPFPVAVEVEESLPAKIPVTWEELQEGLRAPLSAAHIGVYATFFRHGKFFCRLGGSSSGPIPKLTYENCDLKPGLFSSVIRPAHSASRLPERSTPKWIPAEAPLPHPPSPAAERSGSARTAGESFPIAETERVQLESANRHLKNLLSVLLILLVLLLLAFFSIVLLSGKTFDSFEGKQQSQKIQTASFGAQGDYRAPDQSALPQSSKKDATEPGCETGIQSMGSRETFKSEKDIEPSNRSASDVTSSPSSKQSSLRLEESKSVAGAKHGNELPDAGSLNDMQEGGADAPDSEDTQSFEEKEKTGYLNDMQEGGADAPDSEDAQSLEKKEKAGYLITVQTDGKRVARWEAGCVPPANANLVTTETPDVYRATRPGYAWVPDTLTDVWTPGLAYPEKEGVVAGAAEGEWVAAEPGYTVDAQFNLSWNPGVEFKFDDGVKRTTSVWADVWIREIGCRACSGSGVIETDSTCGTCKGEKTGRIYEKYDEKSGWKEFQAPVQPARGVVIYWKLVSV